nr:ribonuclease H-like domain-containing protein [Tanacetum cinerariifolium]
MQKYRLKQQFECFSVSNLEGLHNGYERFQSLLSQLETHGVGISTKDANQKFLRSLPSSWSHVSLIMRTKPVVDTLNFDELYNNPRVFEYDVKVLLLMAVTHKSKALHHTLMISCTPSLLINPVVHNWIIKILNRDNGKRPVKQDEHKAMVTIDREGVDWTGHVKDKTENYALMDYNSSNSVSDTEEYESDIDDEHVTIPSKEQEKPSFAFINTFEHIKTPRQTVKEQHICSQNPTPNNRDWDGLMSKIMGLGYVFTKKACFVCGSFSHLNKDCDFNEKRMAKQIELNKQKGQSTPDFKRKCIVDSGCSRHMKGNKAYLIDYQDINGGLVDFGGTKDQITGKVKIKAGMLNFEDVYFVKEIQHFNLFFMSQMCDKKNKFLFTDTECLVLSPYFKLPNENQVLLRVPRQHNIYSFNLENNVPSGSLACLIAKATIDESTKWHRRMTIHVLLVTKERNTWPHVRPK